MSSANCRLLCVVIGISIVSLAYSATVVTVDPADRLMNKVLLGEWNTDGNVEGWTGTNVTGLSATGGNLQGTGSAATPTVQKTGITGGPDLDFGYFDYLQIRIRVPSGFTSDVGFSFGTSTHTGFATAREFTIPNASLVKDNALHAYRLDLGLDVWWRDTLTDIRVKPLGSSGNGVIFYIDYVEVGDLPGDILQVNTTSLNIHGGETLEMCNRVESKHYVMWYSPHSYELFPSLDPAVVGRRACRMAEESYQVFTKILNLTEPSFSFIIPNPLPGRYKTNHVTWYNGFWGGGDSLGFGHVGINGGGLQDESRGNPLPHEYGHVFQMHQGGNLVGGHWESFANVLRNAKNMYFSETMDPNHPADIGYEPIELSTHRQDHGRLIYADYRVHYALQYYPGAGNPSDLLGRTWKEGGYDMTIYNKLAAILPGGASAVPDTVTYGLRHWPFLDFGADGTKMKTTLWPNATQKAWWFYYTGGLLVPQQDKSGWYRSMFDRSPQKYGFIYNQLVPSSTSITVELQGLDVSGTTEGWRWCLAERDSSDVLRYSNIFSPGTQSWTLNSTSNKVYLIVVATPSDMSLDLTYEDWALPVDKCAARLQYPYEVRLVNCTPATAGRQLDYTESGGHAHSNGGGYVGPSATVDSTAYVGPNARVLGTAHVHDYARIEDFAIVMGSATVQNYAVVSGYAVVTDSAIVQGNAKARDRAIVSNGTVQGNAVLGGYSRNNGINVSDYAILDGVCSPSGSAVTGTAILSYDYAWDKAVSNGVHFDHVPWGWWFFDTFDSLKTKPRGLVASYSTQETDGQVWWDEFGNQHALLRGTPERVEDATFNSKVLRLDGTTEYAVLDRSLVDSIEGSISVWVKPDDNTSRPIIYMGSSATKYCKLALDGTGKAVYTISNGTTTNTVTSTSTIPTGSWTYLAVTVSGTQLKIYVNGGAAEATTSSTLSPDDVLGSNDYTNADGMFVGRDWAGTTFDGDVEDVRFYNVAMTDAEVGRAKIRCGGVVGEFYWDGAKDFNGTSTTDQSGIQNGVTRVLEAKIYPHTSDDVTYYQGILDSSYEENGNYEGTGFGLDNGKLIVRLDNVGFWDPNVTISLNVWTTIVLRVDGSLATLVVNGTTRGTKAYSATQDDVSHKNFRIGFAEDTVPIQFYFDGLIKEVRISERSSIVGDPTPLPSNTPAPTNTPWPNQASDNFSSTHNYLTQGTTGTIWDGFHGQEPGETVDAMNANIDRAGQLFIRSTGEAMEGNGVSPFLYRNIAGDFIATVHITDFANVACCNDCGLICCVADVNAAGPGEDYIVTRYMPYWVGNLFTPMDDGVAVGDYGIMHWSQTWIQLERRGNDVHIRTSVDGTLWNELIDSPYPRADFNGLPLQVGIWHGTYNAGVQGYAAFDAFNVQYAGPAEPTNTPYIRIMSGVDGWEMYH